jgi:hypothetical protein
LYLYADSTSCHRHSFNNVYIIQLDSFYKTMINSTGSLLWCTSLSHRYFCAGAKLTQKNRNPNPKSKLGWGGRSSFDVSIAMVKLQSPNSTASWTQSNFSGTRLRSIFATIVITHLTRWRRTCRSHSHLYPSTRSDYGSIGCFGGWRHTGQVLPPEMLSCGSNNSVLHAINHTDEFPKQ